MPKSAKHASNTPRQKCDGKNRYPRRVDAEIVKEEQEIIDPNLSLKIYHCPTCGDWHLTRSE